MSFVAIPNKFLNESKLSLRAKGLYVHLLLMSSGSGQIERNHLYFLQLKLKIGRLVFFSLLKELKREGYLDCRIEQTESNTFKVIYELPETEVQN